MTEVVVLVGPPNAGKSRYAATQYPRHRIFEPDRRYDGVKAKELTQIDACLAGDTSVVVDGLNYRPPSRADYLQLARKHGARATAVHVATPLATCLARRLERPRSASLIRRIHGELVPPTEAEGFDAVHVGEPEGVESLSLPDIISQLRNLPFPGPTVLAGGAVSDWLYATYYGEPFAPHDLDLFVDRDTFLAILDQLHVHDDTSVVPDGPLTEALAEMGMSITDAALSSMTEFPYHVIFTDGMVQIILRDNYAASDLWDGATSLLLDAFNFTFRQGLIPLTGFGSDNGTLYASQAALASIAEGELRLIPYAPDMQSRNEMMLNRSKRKLADFRERYGFALGENAERLLTADDTSFLDGAEPHRTPLCRLDIMAPWKEISFDHS